MLQTRLTKAASLLTCLTQAALPAIAIGSPSDQRASALVAQAQGPSKILIFKPLSIPQSAAEADAANRSIAKKIQGLGKDFRGSIRFELTSGDGKPEFVVADQNHVKTLRLKPQANQTEITGPFRCAEGMFLYVEETQKGVETRVQYTIDPKGNTTISEVAARSANGRSIVPALTDLVTKGFLSGEDKRDENPAGILSGLGSVRALSSAVSVSIDQNPSIHIDPSIAAFEIQRFQNPERPLRIRLNSFASPGNLQL